MVAVGGEVACGEVAALDESYGKGVAHDQLRCGAAGGSQVVGAGLVLHSGVEHDVGLMGEERVAIADDGDETVAEVFDEWDEHLNLWSVAAFGNAYHHIVGTHHTEVAVNGVGGMKEQRRCTGGIHGGDNLGGYVGALADTGHNNASRGRKQSLYGLCEGIVYMVEQVFYCFFFVSNYLNGNLFYFFTALHSIFYFVSLTFFCIFVKRKNTLTVNLFWITQHCVNYCCKR